MIRRIVWLVFTITVLMVGVAQAQVTQLEGRVTSQAGGPVADAEFTAINMATNLSLTGLTDAQGVVQPPLHLPVGTYRLTVTAQGFRITIVEGIELHVAIPARVNVTLQPGDPSQEVTVTASETQAVINTTSGELNTLVNCRQILDLPLNGRNPLELSGWQAGVATNTTIAQAAINGLRGTYNNVTQDGINIQDNFLRTEGLFGVTAPSVENVLEFSIVTQNSGPEAGLGVAQVRLVTPSGGNTYHGSGFYFHRNTAFNANSFFNNAAGLKREALLRHQFGGRAGGPILKNKLFFFGYYEGTREAQETSLLRTVLKEDKNNPLLSARRGIFRYRRPDDGNLDMVNLFTFTALDFDPTMRQILSLIPPDNDSSIGDGVNTAGFRFNSSRPRDVDLFGFRLDYTLSRHSLEAIFSQFDLRLPEGFQNIDPAIDIGEKFPGLPGGGHDSVRRFDALAWRADLNTARTLTNELRWGIQQPTFTSFTRDPLPGGVQLDRLRELLNRARLELPLVDNPIQNFLGEQRKTLVYEFADNATWLRGNHNIRFGGYLRLIRTTLRNDNGIIPSFALGFGGGQVNPLAPGEALFPGEIPNASIPVLLAPAVRQRASDLLALLTGVLDSATQTFNVRRRTDSEFTPGLGEQRTLRQRFLSFYGGDTFRFRPNLTLNFGLRWELYTVPTEADGLALLPMGGLEALSNSEAMIGFAGVGTGRSFFNNDLNNFAPNLSLAWDPLGDGRTSVRVGYAISYVIDNSLTAALNALDANPGLRVTQPVPNLTGTVSDGIAAGLQQLRPPEFKVPRTLADQLALSPLNGLFTFDPNFRAPYVQQWALSLEREIFRDTAVEVRYAGNRGVKLARAIDLNQPDFVSNKFLEDFRRAQFNLERTGNPYVGLPLEIFPLLADRGQTVLLNPVVQELIRQGEIGEVLFFMFQNRATVFGTSNVGIPARIKPEFFYLDFQNPNALFTNFLGNNSFSSYHALQTEVRRRLSRGLYLQANYTFSKVLTDFSGAAENLAPRLDVNRPRLERRRANFDVTHAFSGNFLYELPLGSGRTSGALSQMLAGWQLSGIVSWRSGPPLSIISGLGTFVRRENSQSNTVVLTGLTIPQLQAMTGSFRLADGSPVLFDPQLFERDESGNLRFFRNPAAGDVGTLGLTPVNGPGYFNVDFSLIKRTKLTDKVDAEFHAEFFNIFNHVNWALRRNALGDVVENINELNFGKIVDTFDPRIIQFALKFNF